MNNPMNARLAGMARSKCVPGAYRYFPVLLRCGSSFHRERIIYHHSNEPGKVRHQRQAEDMARIGGGGSPQNDHLCGSYFP